jgi:hypothetical protein
MSTTELNIAKNTLHEIAVHAHNLAMGLQNAAPPQAQEKGPVKSVQYLLEMAVHLEKASVAIAELAPAESSKKE